MVGLIVNPVNSVVPAMCELWKKKGKPLSTCREGSRLLGAAGRSHSRGPLMPVERPEPCQDRGRRSLSSLTFLPLCICLYVRRTQVCTYCSYPHVFARIQSYFCHLLCRKFMHSIYICNTYICTYMRSLYPVTYIYIYHISVGDGRDVTICMYIPTYIHTYLHTYIHTYIRTYVHTDIQPYGQTRMHACRHTCIQRDRRPDRQSNRCAQVHMRMRMHLCQHVCSASGSALR